MTQKEKDLLQAIEDALSKYTDFYEQWRKMNVKSVKVDGFNGPPLPTCCNCEEHEGVITNVTLRIDCKEENGKTSEIYRVEQIDYEVISDSDDSIEVKITNPRINVIKM